MPSEITRNAHLLLAFALLLAHARAILQSHADSAPLINGKEMLLKFQPDQYMSYKFISTLHGTQPTTRIIITACTAPIEWNVFQSTVGNASTAVLLHSSITNDRESFDFPPLAAAPREYNIKLKMNCDGYGSIVMANATDRGHTFGTKSLALQMKWKSEHDLVLRWHKHTKAKNYCVILSIKRHYSNLCAAMSYDEYNHLINTTSRNLAASFIANYMAPDYGELIYCTNTNLLKLNVAQLLQHSKNESKRTRHITTNLFGFDAQSHILSHMASNETFSITPSVTLRENKMAMIKVSRNEDPITMALKILQTSFTNSILDLYVVPCDARLHLDVEVAFNGNQLATRRDLAAFGKLSVPNVQQKKIYTITVAPSQHQNVSASISLLKGVQIFATTLSSEFNPFPEMPRRPAAKEYRTLRTCTSVTVGWIPPNGLRMANYCLVVKQGKADQRSFQGNQCNTNGHLRRGKVARNDVAKMCKQMKHTARISVLTQKIDKLKSGKFYTVQILVRKPKGRMLSYETLQVRTKSKC